MTTLRSAGRMLALPILLATLSCSADAAVPAPDAAAPATDTVVETPATPAASAPAARPEGTPDLQPIMDKVAEIRGLPFKKQVPAKVQALDDLEAYLAKQIDEFLPEATREGMQQGLLRLGMLLEPIDFGEEFTQAMLSQAAAYYDPETATFYYLMTEMPENTLQTVAAHELVHALQDQHFGLGKIMERMEAQYASGIRNDDQLLAFRFLVEGEATYVQVLWELGNMGMAVNEQMEEMNFSMMSSMDARQMAAMAKNMLPEGGDDDPIMKAMREMENIPPYLLEPLYAAYTKGAYFSMKLRHNGGWEQLAAAYASLPQSTEQALDYTKFTTDRDDPSPMVLPALPALEAAGWERIDAAIHGELYLNMLLRNFEVDRAEAQRATAGWDGDVYHAYRNDQGRVLVVLATTWDTEDDAREFFDAYRTVLAAKYPGLAAPPRNPAITRYGYESVDPALGASRVIRRDREVFVIEGGSAKLTETIAAALLAMPVEHVE